MNKIQEIRAQAKKLKLFGHELLDRFSDQELEWICNGIGPGYFPEKLRRKISSALPHLKLPAALHDVGYHVGGSYADFLRVNSELAANARICAVAEFPWWDPRRYLVIRAGSVAADLCNQFGFLAWGLKQGNENDAI